MNKKFRTIVAAVLLVFIGVTMASCSKTKVYVSQPKLELKVGDSYSLLAGVSEGRSGTIDYATYEMDSWESDDTDIATVEKIGKTALVKAVSPGKCKITAKYNGKSDFCRVTVTE